VIMYRYHPSRSAKIPLLHLSGYGGLYKPTATRDTAMWERLPASPT
jgi:hypothetical protein